MNGQRLAISAFIERDIMKAVNQETYLVPVEEQEFAVLRALRPSKATEDFIEFLREYGYGRIGQSVDGSISTSCKNVVLHPRFVVEALDRRPFSKSGDLLPIMEWDPKLFLALRTSGPDTGKVVFSDEPATVVASSLHDLMEKLADDPQFFLPKYVIVDDLPVLVHGPKLSSDQ